MSMAKKYMKDMQAHSAQRNAHSDNYDMPHYNHNFGKNQKLDNIRHCWRSGEQAPFTSHT